jgi:hypothetical protein
MDLDSILTATEKWLDAYSRLPPVDMIGIHVDNFTQFLHCIVVLFKLTIYEAPGWDPSEVRKRLDVFQVLDSTYQQIDDTATAAGLVDADGPRSGLFFKAKHLWRAIKALLAAEMPTEMTLVSLEQHPAQPTPEDANGILEDVPMDDFIMGLADEPWLSDIFTYEWPVDDAFDMGPFAI